MKNKKGPFSQEVLDAWDAKKTSSKAEHPIAEPEMRIPYPLPKPQMRLYGVKSLIGDGEYFDSMDELIEHIRKNDCSLSSLCALEYLGQFAGREHVICCTDRNGHMTIERPAQFGMIEIFDREMSVLEGMPIWIGGYGDLRSEYEALEKRGISFEDDTISIGNSLYSGLQSALEEAQEKDNKRGRTK